MKAVELAALQKDCWRNISIMLKTPGSRFERYGLVTSSITTLLGGNYQPDEVPFSQTAPRNTERE
jgi:hypothetical protein